MKRRLVEIILKTIKSILRLQTRVSYVARHPDYENTSNFIKIERKVRSSHYNKWKRFDRLRCADDVINAENIIVV